MVWLICGILSLVNAGLSLWLSDMGNFWSWTIASGIHFFNWQYIGNHRYIDLLGAFCIGMAGMTIFESVVKIFGG